MRYKSLSRQLIKNMPESRKVRTRSPESRTPWEDSRPSSPVIRSRSPQSRSTSPLASSRKRPESNLTLPHDGFADTPDDRHRAEDRRPLSSSAPRSDRDATRTTSSRRNSAPELSHLSELYSLSGDSEEFGPTISSGVSARPPQSPGRSDERATRARRPPPPPPPPPTDDPFPLGDDDGRT